MVLSIEFPGQGRLIRIVADYSLNFSSQNEHVIDLLDRLGNSVWPPSSIEDIRSFLQVLLSLGQELRICFTVPNQKMMSNNFTPTPTPNELVATFVNFLLLIVQDILRFEPDSIASIKDSIQVLCTELEFLITFLGDTPMHLRLNEVEETSNLLKDIEAVVNEVGSLLYSFVLTIIIFILVAPDETNNAMTDMEVMVNEVGSLLHSDYSTLLKDIELQTTEFKETKNAIEDMKALVNEVESFLDFFGSTRTDQVPENGILVMALSDLLPKFELMKEKIKDHCIAFSKMPIDMAPRIAVVSLFIVDSVLDDLVHLMNHNTIVGANNQIVTLHHELKLLQSSVTDIVVQQQEKHEELVIRTRDIAYEIEYVINSFPPIWYLNLRLPQLIEKIELIRMETEEMKNTIDATRMPEVARYTHEQVSKQTKEHLFLEDIVVGFENEAIEIAEQLIGAPDKLQIISICGMPGLGKTTLAKKLYNDPTIVYRFDERAWCVVSQTYNKRNILVDILRSISYLKRETIMTMDDESLAEDLYKSLKGRRYLIVMDDIWDINAWNDLKRYFPNDNVGSRILFTTRNKEVSLKASPRSVPNVLPFLSEVECWELLQRKVFLKELCPQELLDIGKQIARNCHGLPLAVTVIAAVLANIEKKKHLWKEVAENLSSHISRNPNNCNYLLELSYNHLPIHLKPCFLYLGAFEEDREIPVRKLISLWVAEGFIKTEEQKSSEDVAHEYFMELINRSLVLVAKRRSDGKVKTCKIHDLLREMCLRIAGEENFLKVIKDDDDLLGFFNQVSMYQQHHHLSINDVARPSYSLPFGLHVRSLLYTSSEPSTLISHSFNVLRVLDSSERSTDFNDVIGIELLFHLRYLAISCAQLHSIENLRKLEFIFVDNQREVEIPDILLTMGSLRHVYFRGGACFSASCRQQANKDESFQINNLQTISLLHISDETDEKLLRCSPNLRRLKCKVGSVLNPSFNFFSQLESLTLSGSGLTSLPLNLKKLTLKSVKMSLEQMEIIGRLLNLEVLKLHRASFDRNKWDTSEGEFPQLKFLKLHYVQIVEWNTSSDHFPRLQRLLLEHCHLLKMIPSSLGDIPTLQTIKVYGCAQAIEESASKIQEEQQDMGNEELKVMIFNE